MSVHYQALYFRRGQRTALLVAAMPFVRFVGITGSVAQYRATKQSDINYLVFAEPGRLFTARWFVTALIQLLGLRRHGKKIAGRMCLNHYQTTDALKVAPHSDEHAGDLRHVIPIVDRDRWYEEFQAANSWFTEHPIDQIHTPRVSRSLKYSLMLQRVLETSFNGRFGDRIERWLRAIQINKINRNPLTRKEFAARLQISDQQLLFHQRGPDKYHLIPD